MKMTPFYTIFYADDDRDDRDIFSSVVKEINESHDLHIQRNGDELLHALDNPPPQAQMVFLDLNMPGKNGYEALAEIRANQKMDLVPVIVFSTSSDEVSIQQSRALGANLYITKPDSYDVLKKVLEDVLAIDWVNNPPDFKNFTYIAN